MTKTVAIIGASRGIGLGFARAYAGDGWSTHVTTRAAGDPGELGRIKGNVTIHKLDVRNSHEITELAEYFSKIGIDIFIHNAVRGTRGNFLEFTPEELQSNLETNVIALHRLSQIFAPKMIEKGFGSIIVTGNTSAHRGKANFGGTASTKAAQRVLTESMARYLGPKGIHVAYITIDAAIDLEWTRKMWPEKPDEFFIQPDDIAEEAWHIAHQNKSAWTFDQWLRPFGENW